MKWITFVALALSYGSMAFAAAQISCQSEDGSGFQAIIDESNQVFQVKTKVRDGEFKARPYAHVSGLELIKQSNGPDLVKSIVITDERKIVVAVAAGTYADEFGGLYDILTCEASF